LRDCDAQGYSYLGQIIFVNAGSIRNQGWELQGRTTIGPVGMSGTYSFTKSRVLGVTPRYQQLLANHGILFVKGAAFNFMTEHTWATTFEYAHAATAVALTLNGIGKINGTVSGQACGNVSLVCFAINYGLRLQNESPIQNLNFGESELLRQDTRPPYVMADLNASQRLAARLDAVVQVHNLGNFYPNDLGFGRAVPGRNTTVGLTWRY
jgi:outer membrane receptor protein involved in Fe transport